jgi:hypothetical protein
MAENDNRLITPSTGAMGGASTPNPHSEGTIAPPLSETSEGTMNPGILTRKGGAFAERLALVGFALYACFAPHSIAGAEISLALVAIAWLIRIFSTHSTGLFWTKVDLPTLLFVAWTACSSFLSEEPRIAIAKLQSVFVVFLMYLARTFITRRTAVFLVSLMIASGVAGSIWSVTERAIGRGVVIESMSADSPFRRTEVISGDAIWRLGGKKVASVAKIDDIIASSAAGTQLGVSVIRNGEHGDFPGFVVTEQDKLRTNPSGITGDTATHRFRASGWTRHYETFSETLQILAQLALGLALAGFLRRSTNRSPRIALAAAAMLTVGIALTAMRTVLVGLIVGAGVVAWRTGDKRLRLSAVFALLLVVMLGAFAVYRTRAAGAVALHDDSASLRFQVAKAGAARIMFHPFFGVGMDAVHRHWHDWGFPGDVIIHTHSTPLELAFERGLPALLFWCWILIAFWRITSAAERSFRTSDNAKLHGLTLGALGSITGFVASSLVNYNFGDGEVALVFWFLMGTIIAIAPKEITATNRFNRT